MGTKFSQIASGGAFNSSTDNFVAVRNGTTDVLLTSGIGTISTTGSPSSGNLIKFSGATSITNGDLSGDVTTSGALTTTVAKIVGTTVSGTTGTTNVVFSASPTLTGPVTVSGAINSTIAQTTLSGTTAGNVVWSQPLQGVSWKKFVGHAAAYENNSASNQAITYTTAFINTPTIVANDTGLTLSTTTTTLTITAPNNTITFTGNIIIEGF